MSKRPASTPIERQSKRRNLLDNTAYETDSHGFHFAEHTTCNTKNVRSGIVLGLENGCRVIIAFNTIAGKITWHKGTNNTAPLKFVCGKAIQSAIADLNCQTLTNSGEGNWRRRNALGAMAFYYNKEGPSQVGRLSIPPSRPYNPLAQRLHHMINVFAGEQVDAKSYHAPCFTPGNVKDDRDNGKECPRRMDLLYPNAAAPKGLARTSGPARRSRQ